MRTRLVAAAAFVAMTASWVFAAEVTSFPPDVTWAARLDVQKIMESDWGPRIRERAAEPVAAARLNAVKVLLGVDLVDDIQSVAICGRAQDKSSVVIYVAGNLDAERLLALAAVGQGYSVSQYSDYEIHSWDNKGKIGRGYGTFARDDLLLFAGSEATMQAALDALSGNGPSASADLVDALSDPTDFLSGVALGVNTLPDLQRQTAVLENVRDLTASLGAAGGMLRLSLGAVTENVETAAYIRDVLSGLRALVLLDASRHPGAAELCARAQIEQDGTSVRVTVTATEEELKRLEQNRGNRPSPL